MERRWAERTHRHVRDRLLRQPGEPVFGLVDHGRLAERTRADPALPGLMGIQPSAWASAEFLLDVNGWLTDYQVALV